LTNEECKDLCLRLMQADTEDEVIAALSAVGLWDDSQAWRLYGDYENNYNTVGNQQSRPDAALVEKLVNSVDARLMNECMVREIDPTGSDAPRTIREAVARFFEERSNPRDLHAGRMSDWTDAERTAVARDITVCATGDKRRPSFTVADRGEGQTPLDLPDTILSLHRDNKLRIPFVQGKFNMGGTGALKFAGRRNLQLVVSRRNPRLLSRPRPSDSDWGFTVVRREDPTEGRRSSVYTYLAPLGSDTRPRRGEVVHFSTSSMPIFPDGVDPYARHSEWGTLIKLYEYDATSFRSDMLRRDGFLRKADLLLPDVALPIRFHECRDYSGPPGSHENTLTGLRVRLDDDRASNLEPEFPASADLVASGERMTAAIYAFRKNRAATYRGNEAVIFTINGQTHGHLTQDFLARKRVGLAYLKESLLVIVDCTGLSGRAREDLFMNSRDRLSEGDLRHEVEEELEDLLRNHPGLRALRERRRREQIEETLADSRPLEEVLSSLLARSPTMAALFLRGERASSPFRTTEVEGADAFVGVRFPTFFKFKGLNYGKVLERDCNLGSRCRITFETDAANDYFERRTAPGEFRLVIVRGDELVPYVSGNLPLHNGIATLSLKLPADSSVGDELHMVASVTDDSREKPFENPLILHVLPPVEHDSGTPGRRPPPGTHKGSEREKAAGIALPKITPVRREDWENLEPPFDQLTALRVRDAGAGADAAEDGEPPTVYDFFVNVDNLHLKREQKASSQDPKVIEARFTYGLVLLGIGMLRDDGMSHGEGNGTAAERADDMAGGVEDRIEAVTRAVAPVVVPMIEELGKLEEEG